MEIGEGPEREIVREKMYELSLLNSSGPDKLQTNKLLTELYQKTGVLKVQAVQEYVLGVCADETKIIVFAYHVTVLDALQSMLEKEHIGYGFYL